MSGMASNSHHVCYSCKESGRRLVCFMMIKTTKSIA